MTISRFCLLLAFISATLFASMAPAADRGEAAAEPCDLAITIEQIEHPSPRELKAEAIADSSKLSIKNATPQTLEQKYLARVAFEMPNLPERVRLTREDANGNTIYETLPYFGHHMLISSEYGAPKGYRSFDGCFQEMIAAMPDDHRPAKEDVAFFTASSINRLLDVTQLERSLERPARLLSFTILAKTPEEAEHRVRTLVTILDQGYSRPLQLSRFHDHQEACQQRQEWQQKLAAGKSELEKVQANLEKFGDFTPEVLTTLQSQRAQQEVDVAGVKARLALIATLLQRDLSTERKEQLEGVKLTAEIELVGLEARQAKAVELITHAKERGQMVARSEALGKEVATATRYIRSFNDRATRLAPQIEAFRRMPVAENKIVTQPIEWTQ